MLTSKQRAHLKGLANTMETILQVGKAGIGEALIKQVDEALEARELIKLRVLETAPDEADGIAGELAQATGAEVVQRIGTRVILYRRNEKQPRIKLG